MIQLIEWLVPLSIDLMCAPERTVLGIDGSYGSNRNGFHMLLWRVGVIVLHPRPYLVFTAKPRGHLAQRVALCPNVLIGDDADGAQWIE